MENNYSNLPEQEEMKRRISLLKHKLENQEIINDELLKKSIKGKLDDINRNVVKSVFGCILAIVLCCIVFISRGMSVVFVISTIIMLFACGLMTVYCHRKLMKRDFLDDNLVDAVCELMKFRKRYKNWTAIVTPIVVVWLLWLAVESCEHLGELATPFISGAFMGCLIGGYYGYKMNRQTVRKADQLLSEIESLKRG